MFILGTAVAQWLRYCDIIRKVAGSISPGVSGFFIDIKSFWSHYDPGVDTASNRNEYREYFLGGKGGRCVRLTTYHHSVPLSWNLGTLTSWKPLGLSRPVMGFIYLFLGVHSSTPWCLLSSHEVTILNHSCHCWLPWDLKSYPPNPTPICLHFNLTRQRNFP